jgi:hypothetical protein
VQFLSLLFPRPVSLLPPVVSFCPCVSSLPISLPCSPAFCILACASCFALLPCRPILPSYPYACAFFSFSLSLQRAQISTLEKERVVLGHELRSVGRVFFWRGRERERMVGSISLFVVSTISAVTWPVSSLRPSLYPLLCV